MNPDTTYKIVDTTELYPIKHHLDAAPEPMISNLDATSSPSASTLEPLTDLDVNVPNSDATSTPSASNFEADAALSTSPS